jgi:hypothetical protein
VHVGVSRAAVVGGAISAEVARQVRGAGVLLC